MMIGTAPFLRTQASLLLLSGIVLLLVFEFTNLDIHVNNLFYDAQTQSFPLRHHPFMTQVMHHGLKTTMLVAGIGSIALAIWKLRQRSAGLRSRHVWVGSLGIILIPSAIALLKRATNKHCPWSLDIYGGNIPYTGLFETHAAQFGAGQCFPAGHASGGFMLFSWAVALWIIQPKLAKCSLYLAVALGVLMGVARMMQGAHFLSHVLWTAWFSWAISMMLAAAFGIFPNQGTQGH